MKGFLELENGIVMEGHLFGSQVAISGEVVFQTGMVGYPESLTDPSYSGQLLCLTYPMIGNYGVPAKKYDGTILQNHESEKIHVSALIVQELCHEPSHYLMHSNLDQWLKDNNVVGISGIDTRYLTQIIREYGTMKGRIYNNAVEIKPEYIDISKEHLVNKVSTYDCKITGTSTTSQTILVIDCGIKHSQINCLHRQGFNIEIKPHDYKFIDHLDNYNGIFISNGPGDPEMNIGLIEQLKEIFDKRIPIPIFGICLGHQIVGLAGGLKTYKMKYGNRGHNLPAHLVGTERCLLTSQNHGYAVELDSSSNWKELFVNANDGSNEGLYYPGMPWFSVQFHPESNAGPNDSRFLFDVFYDIVNNPMHEPYKLIKNHLPSPVLDPITVRKVLILGSGGLTIGQAGEFDYSGSQAIKAYKEEGVEVVLINPNIATIQTSTELTDKIYYLPVNFKHVLEVIRIERPDAITVSFGGQTALNCGVELYRAGILDGMKILGTSIKSVIESEDRALFRERIQNIGEPMAPSLTTSEISQAIEFAEEVCYPVLVRSAFALGGFGSGFADNRSELEKLVDPIVRSGGNAVIDKSVKGWKELEYEIVRDRYDNCMTICNMENVDPVGVHTGESVVVAPSQTLDNYEYQMLRDVAIKVAREFDIVGECNIQYALDPNSRQYYIIEINARLSRSSALASKATGYPLAYVAAKLSLGKSLLELRNSITRKTTACFEPSLDYCVVKVPRWDLKKFPGTPQEIGSAMKSVGEVMAISRTFEEGVQKAFRMADESVQGVWGTDIERRDHDLDTPTYDRYFRIANEIEIDMLTKKYHRKQISDLIHQTTMIDKWFLNKFINIVDCALNLKNKFETPIDLLQLVEAKRYGFTDAQIAQQSKSTETVVAEKRRKSGIVPIVKQIDTVAAEFPCYTNYLYLTYNASHHDLTSDTVSETSLDGREAIMVLGSGVYRIGSSVEFDWCAVNSIREIRKQGYQSIMVNYNPETVSTDYDEADRLYFEELSFETIMEIYLFENPSGVILSMGGQQPNNIAMNLSRQGLQIMGTSAEMIDNAENRYKFSRMLDRIGIDQPEWRELTSLSDIEEFITQVGYPCLVRPSYVLSGAAMSVVYTKKELESALAGATKISKEYPVVVSKFIQGAKEIEVDAVARDGWVELLAVSEHVENAGVHSGDATLVFPSQDLTIETIKTIRQAVYKIADALKVNGPFNIQFMAKNDQIKVIECNLRVSRSFPFISKVMDLNFIQVATRMILGLDSGVDQKTFERIKRQKTLNGNIGVKVAQFSFDRLPGADAKLGVEMLSTGEVACFGSDRYQAYLKALEASRYKIPYSEGNIFISIGSFQFKEEFLSSAKTLMKLGYNLYGSYGTSDYFRSCGTTGMTYLETTHILNMIKNKQFQFIIIVSDHSRVGREKTSGYEIRRTAIDYGIPILTDIKTSKFLVSALNAYPNGPPISEGVDSKTSYKLVRIPPLVDIHSHIRDFEESAKETWKSGTMSALAGGFGLICAMPNTKPALDSLETWTNYQEIAERDSVIHYRINFLGSKRLIEETESWTDQQIRNYFEKIGNMANGLKLFLNLSHGGYILSDPSDWNFYFKWWTKGKTIYLHATGFALGTALFYLNGSGHKIHVCHISGIDDLNMVQLSKNNGNNITCEVTPHHLFLNSDQHSEWANRVCPGLMPLKEQVELWKRLDQIDCIATDHAPHFKGEKTVGFTNFETVLGLFLQAVREERLSMETVVEKLCQAPLRILGLPQFNLEKNYIELRLDKEWTITDSTCRFSKAGWTPFSGLPAFGTLKKVVLGGNILFNGDQHFGQVENKNIFQSETIDDKSSDEEDEEEEMDLHVDETRVGFKPKDLISVEQFNRGLLRKFFNRVSELRQLGQTDILKGKIIGTVFLEPSSRTKLSFCGAMMRMGGQVIDLDPGKSSIKKGESDMDTLKTVQSYVDLICLRSGTIGLAEKASKILNCHLINCGESFKFHPTQALLDIYTIREELGSVNNITITILNDCKFGRTVHSLVKLLCNYEGIKINYITSNGLGIPPEIHKYAEERGIEQYSTTDLNSVIKGTDVLYVTRIQRERFESEEEYLSAVGKYRIEPSTLYGAKSNLIIMHPLPRNNEISEAMDADPRSAYFRQMQNGLYVRMAILEMLLVH